MVTHISYTSLPKPIINSGCKIIYLCRDPKDMMVSLWHFSQIMEDHDLKDAFELFCKGVSMGGRYWNHVLGYWRTSLESSKGYCLQSTKI